MLLWLVPSALVLLLFLRVLVHVLQCHRLRRLTRLYLFLVVHCRREGCVKAYRPVLRVMIVPCVVRQVLGLVTWEVLVQLGRRCGVHVWLAEPCECWQTRSRKLRVYLTKQGVRFLAEVVNHLRLLVEVNWILKGCEVGKIIELGHLRKLVKV